MQVKVEDEHCTIMAAVFGFGRYDYEPPSFTCPGGEDIEIDRLTEMEVEMSWSDGDDHEHEILFYLQDEVQIAAFLEAWGVDPMDAYDKRWEWEGDE